MSYRIFNFEGSYASPPPAEAASLSTFYFRKNHLNFLHRYPDGTAVRISRDDVISVLKAERSFDTQQNLDQFFYDIRRNNAIDYDGPLPGYRLGLHTANGQSLYCSAAPNPVLPQAASARPLEPVQDSGESGAGPDETKWPVIAELIKRLLTTPESGDLQRLTLLAHLKVAHAALLLCLAEPDSQLRRPKKRNVRPQQALAICGPVSSGKTFLFEEVISPILGNRVVDAFKAFCSSAEGFTGELLNGEVWKIDDRHGSTRADVRRTFASNIKSYLFSGNVSIHPKGKTPLTIAPFGRLFIICNDEDKDMLVLPDLTPDMLDKVIVLRSVRAESPMPAATDTERDAYQSAVEAELPRLVAALQNWQIPPALKHIRTGVKSYHNPVISGKLEASHPEVLLVELIHQAIDDNALLEPGETMWNGTATDLHKTLTNVASHAFARSASELLSSPKSTGIYLGRLAGDAEHFAARYRLHVRHGPQRKGIVTYLIHQVPDETDTQTQLPYGR